MNTNFFFNKASIFFNFGNPGNQNTIFYFDNVYFGSPLSIQENVLLTNLIHPIPSSGNIFSPPLLMQLRNQNCLL